MSKVYVTYDLEESGSVRPHEVYRGAHELPIDAESVQGWEVGEFKRAWGRDVYGVRLVYRPSEFRGLSEEVFEVPANAQNVQVRFGVIPAEYQEGLRSAA